MLYWLDRPAGYGLTDRPALLIVLHGTDDTAADAMQFWSTRQHELPILIAAPQSVGKGWSDEQSHKNFDMVVKLVNPGEPMVSRLLMHPLAPEGGGDVFHSGGRQFMSVNDPDWKTLAAFVNGATLSARGKK